MERVTAIITLEEAVRQLLSRVEGRGAAEHFLHHRFLPADAGSNIRFACAVDVAGTLILGKFSCVSRPCRRSSTMSKLRRGQRLTSEEFPDLPVVDHSSAGHKGAFSCTGTLIFFLI